MSGKDQSSTGTDALSKTRLRLWLKLLKASGLIEEELRRRLRSECNWTLPRFDVMAALDRAPEGLKMSQISKSLRVSNGNITGIVDKLADEGLAQRVQLQGDRRAHLVQLTDEGKAVFAQHAALHEAWVDEMLVGLDAEMAKEIGKQLDNLIETVEAKDD